MAIDEKSLPGDDDLILLDDDAPAFDAPPRVPVWKILIVDDEPQVHDVTKLVLKEFAFAGRALEFVSAFSAKEAKERLAEHHDAAMVLLDVVMETEDAGLQLARYIREELKNRWIRIVLRTGQPGQAPEEQVILHYDINDYKAKTELTATKLFTTVISALRSYRDIKTLDVNKRGLETILRASTTIFELQSMEKFAAGVLTQLTSLLHLEEDALYCKTHGFAACTDRENGPGLRILSGTGIYADCINKRLEEAVEADVLEALMTARREQRQLFIQDNRYIGYFRHENGSENLLYLQGWEDLSEWDRYLLEIFCANVSIAYDNINLNSEIIETQREIIFKLGEVVETRSRETGNHVKRVAEYTALLARLCGLPDDQIKLLRVASPMHDLGKMAIPDAVLNKPAALTDDEFALMKSHTTVGYDMLKHSKRDLLKTAAIIALEHHEKFDGTGYPNGLSGENIHLCGRITAIADVFDALGVKRAYKDAWPIEKILDYFREQRGKHFDPALVDLFFDNIDAFLAIRDRLPD